MCGFESLHVIDSLRQWRENPKPDNVNVHRAAAKDMQAEKAARPAAPCATYCYHAFSLMVVKRQCIF